MMRARNKTSMAFAAQPVVGFSSWDWRTLFYDPAGGMYRYLNQSDAPNYSPGAAQNAYWAQQRQAVNPFAQGVAQRQQAALQLQQALRQQQMANIAALQSQLAAMPPMSSAAQYAQPLAAAMPGAQYAPPSSMPPGAVVPPVAPDDSTYGGAPIDNSMAFASSVVGAGGEQYVVVKVNNIGNTIKQQAAAQGAGTIINAFYAVAPSQLDTYALGKMRDELKKGLQEKGVDADVWLASTPPVGDAPKGEFVRGAVAGAAGVGVLWLLYKLTKVLIGAVA